ncbi:MAG TPA: TerC/Alx family metal homeostasis membrane protein, partial [Myxococcota bacterium]|nr:TerC/Alx family metal homeostasis membrane protein [Myxococcota bacterium]
LCFNAFIFNAYENHRMGIGLEVGNELDGREAAIEFFTAYVVEKSLSLDNIFVIAMIFSYFEVPLENQHRVLFWGVLGALVMRAAFIISGLALVERFDWLTYVFGALLIATAVKMFIDRKQSLRPEKNALIRFVEKHFAVTSDFHGASFFGRCNGRRVATPLFLSLLVVEASDLVFAIDSIPAVIAVTRDPFIAFSSNAFAILGLRSLYFVVAPLLGRFRMLKLSLIFILAFIGVKMLLAHQYPIPIAVSLSVILAILALGVGASIVFATPEPGFPLSSVEAELDRLVRVSLRGARRIAIALIGSTLLLLGIAMLVLPGPAIAVIPFGLVVLSTEFVWARRWLAQLRAAAANGLPRGARAQTEPRAGNAPEATPRAAEPREPGRSLERGS